MSGESRRGQGDGSTEHSSRALLDHRQYIVIHNNPDGAEGQSSLECQLDRALEHGYTVIVVEPLGLGDHTIRWIRMGNFLHKSAVLASFAVLVMVPFVSRRVANFSALPVALFGVCCAGLYDISWQSDPCCKYQVDYRGRELPRIPSHDIHSTSPVVLVRRNDKYRKVLHNTLAVAVMAYVGWRVYAHFYS